MDLPKHIQLHYGKLRIAFVHEGQRIRETTELEPSKSGIASAISRRNELIEQIKFGKIEDTTKQRTFHTFLRCAELHLQKQLKLGRQATTTVSYTHLTLPTNREV